MDSQRITRIEDVLLEIMDPKHRADYDPDFWWYFRDCFDSQFTHFQRASVYRFIQELSDDFRLARFDPQGKKLLDAGCGYGITTIIMHLMGASEVHGIDQYGPMIQTFEKYLSFFVDIHGIYPEVGNVSKTGYPDNYYDFVLSNEAISHYYDVPGFLKETHRVLKPGGILFISDANNGANPYISWRTKQIWDRFEKGPIGEIFFSAVDEPYLEKRRRIIHDTFGNMYEEEVSTLASGTFGYTKNQIITACDNYIKTKELPNSYYRYGRTPVDPAIDNYQERLIYPISLSHQLSEIGFKNKIYAYFGGSGGNEVIRIINKLVEISSPFSWPIGRALKVVARKQ